MINIKMQPADIQKLSPRIAVIGVGGAGGNAVNNMISSGLEGCEFVVCNTDAQALSASLCERKIQLGADVTGGLGAGSKPEVGKAAAEESIDDVMAVIDGVNMVFVTAGMGGGTGTGAAPEIAKACREQGILTVGVVTKPFHFEGTHRMRSAESGIEQMQDYVDTLIVIPNQNLFKIANEKTTFAEAFKMADTVLQSGVRGVTDLMVRPGLVNLDFADIRTAMLEMGKAMMGTGEATGEKRAIESAEAAINNPLLDDVTMKGAQGVIINVTGGYDMTLFEADEACNRVRDEVDPDANIIFGATFDESLEGYMRVSIVATGIEKEEDVKEPPKTNTGLKPALGTVRSDVVQRSTTMERLKPSTSPASASAMSSAPTSVPQNAVPQTNSPPGPSQASSRNYVPQVATPPSTVPSVPSTAFQPASSSDKKSDSLSGKDEPESDLFEQSEFTASASQVSGGMAHNTALRGTRYKDAFIPPKPVEPGMAPGVAQISTGGVQLGHVSAKPAPLMQPQSTAFVPKAPQSDQSQPQTGGYNLNPPKLPVQQEQYKPAPSLFERITGTVQQAVGGMIGGQSQDYPARPRVAPNPMGEQQTQGYSAPSQPNLNIESPASKETPSDLDIPAFLRRQAN